MSPTADTTLVHAGTFAVLGPDGGLTGRGGSTPDGLFRRDARHLSRWELTVDGARPAVLVPLREEAATATCVLTPPGTRDEPPAYTVVRELAVTSGALVERLRLVNNRPEPRTAHLALLVDADFADQFELRSDHRSYPKGDATRTAHTEPGGVRFTYTRLTWKSRTTVTATPAPETAEPAGPGPTAHRLTWNLAPPPTARPNCSSAPRPARTAPRLPPGPPPPPRPPPR